MKKFNYLLYDKLKFYLIAKKNNLTYHFIQPYKHNKLKYTYQTNLIIIKKKMLGIWQSISLSCLLDNVVS